MSKKPLADDRRRELATEAFAKVVRAAFKGEADKAAEALAVIEADFAEEIDILDRARRFAAMSPAPENGRSARSKTTADRLLAGVLSLNADDLEAAEKDMATVLSEEPKNADAHYIMAVIRARQEKTEDAISSLKLACSLSGARRAQARLDSEFAGLQGTAEFDELTAA